MNDSKQRAKQLIQEQRFAEARHVLESVTVMDDSEVWSLLGMVCGLTGDLPAAESALKRGISLRPEDPVLHNNLGCVLRSLDRRGDAEAEFREAVRLRSGYTSAEVNLGGALSDAGDFSGAERVLRGALAATPDNPEAHNNLGSALRQLGRADEAATCFATAVRLRPDYPDALANLGMSYLFSNSFDNAEACFRKALTVSPDHTSALYYLGFLLHKKERLDEAGQCFRRIIEIEPGHVNAAYFLSIMGITEAPSQSPAEYVQELFDGYADQFDEHLVTTLEYATPGVINRLVRETLGVNSSPIDLVDLGCGTGLCAKYLTDIAGTMVGVDLSERMLEKARSLGIYTHLFQGDVESFLAGQPESCDLIVSGDVFVYIGDLAGIFRTCRQALREGGLMCFSIEKSLDQGLYTLRQSGRFAHNPTYISQLAKEAGLDVVKIEEVVLRKEFGQSIDGQVYVLARNWGAG